MSMLPEVWGVTREGDVRGFEAGCWTDEARRNRDAIGRCWLFFDDQDEAEAIARFIKRARSLEKAITEELNLVLDPLDNGIAEVIVDDPIGSFEHFIENFFKQQIENLHDERNEQIVTTLANQNG